MNMVITILVIALFFVLGCLIGCFVCISRINQLEHEKTCLAEWLEASRKTNAELVKECNGLLADLESVVNGGNIIASTITADEIKAENKKETKED